MRFSDGCVLDEFKLSAGGKITDTCEDPFTREQLYEKIVEILLEKEDAEMSAMGYPQANMLIPKLCLMLSVMECLGIQDVIYRVTNGSTEGLLLC